MSRERIRETGPEEPAHIRRADRARRARQRRRAKGCLLAVAGMIVLGVYAGSHAGRGGTDGSGSGQGPQTVQIQQMQAPASIPAAQAAGLSDGAGDAAVPAKDAPFTDKALEELVSGILDEIIYDGMTELEKARAVFDYAHDQIAYTGHSDKSDWEAGAYTGLTTGKGDCFTYYAVSRAMLTALEIDNLPVERSGGETQHFWNLVNCGKGWYHFDACPRSSKLPPFLSFMFTDRQAADFTAAAGRCYYDFDGSLLPERAAEVMTES